MVKVPTNPVNKHVNNNNVFTRNISALRKQLFLGAVMEQQFTLLLCMLNATHMGPYKYCS